jgi:SM-20-related protein
VTHQVIFGLLNPRESAALLDYAIANEALFADSTVSKESAVKHDVRRSRLLTDLGPHRALLEERVANLVPKLIAELRLSPFGATGFEIELVAHEDQAFYKRHIDVFTGAATPPAESAGDRLISLVYYIHKSPKQFTGGELRLFPQIRPSEISEAGAVDLVPEHGVAIAFSSWLPHEVRPISCPSRKFEDSRFAINCWVLRQRGQPQQL